MRGVSLRVRLAEKAKGRAYTLLLLRVVMGSNMRYGFVIDQTKCIGCHACTVACKTEHDVPVGVFRTWVQYVEKGEFPNTRRTFSVMRCNQCENAPCTKICPTAALFHRPGGIVDFDNTRCIGCKACMQACPYDAIYIDPGDGTAAKCNFCAHRIDAGIRPACEIVCPTNAIISGDLDDPSARIARLVGREPVSVRKPDQGTQPKVFYIGVESINLMPSGARSERNSIWADSPDPELIEHSIMRRSAVEARKAYDVHHATPWGWKVAAYLWTKSIASGVPLVAAVLLIFGWSGRSPLFDWIVPVVGGFFTALTAILLIADLKRPDRFHYLLLKGNPGSWLVRGAYILQVYGLLLGLWFLAGVFGMSAALPPLWWMCGVAASAVAGYTAFLFGQCEGRDLWQSPLFFWHLLSQAAVCGAALLVVLEVMGGAGRNELAPSTTAMLLAVVANAALLGGELGQPSVNADVGRAVHEIVRGRYARQFWFGTALAGLVLPALLLLASKVAADGVGVLALTAGLLALAGVLSFEAVWVKAGQVVPLS